MPTIAEYEIPTLPIMSRGKEIFRVRGLDVEDLTFLAQNYLGDIKQAVEAFGRSKARVIERQSINEFALIAAKDFPALTAEIISRAADESGQADKVRRMPWIIQLTALKDIIVLSTEEAGGLKNLLAALVAALEIDQQKLGKVATYLQSIIGNSVKTSPSSSETDMSSQTDTLS